MKRLNLFVFAIFSLGFIAPGYAFDFTVTTNAPAGNCTTMCTNPAPGTPCLLQNALDVAECNGEGDTLNLAAGTYDASAGGADTFTYNPSDENFPITLMGAPYGLGTVYL